MRFNGFVGTSYTAQSVNIADEECINWYAETNETAGAQARISYIRSPGLSAFVTLPESPVRAQCKINGRYFAIGGSKFCEIASNGTITVRGAIANDSLQASFAVSNTQILIVSALAAYCFTLADNTLVEVTSQLAGKPIQAAYNDTYFIVCFQNSNKYQYSGLLDGTSWPGINVNAVSVFPENIRSIIVDHRELWVYGSEHCQPYQDTGSSEVFDVIPGALIEMGSGCTFGPGRADNTNFWISEDERGGRIAYRASGYTPQRISTHSVETDLSTYADISNLVSYVYQADGHLFWVLYIPGSQWSWVYDVSTGLWAKRAEWHTDIAVFTAHRSWNHCYTFGMHLVGDWQTGTIWNLSLDNLQDNADTLIRRVRRSPTLNDELQRHVYNELRVDFDTGLGTQPPLRDGDGNDRQPQAMLRWSNDGGHTWSNEHWRDCGFAGQYGTFVRWQRLGEARRRIFELVVTDPIPWTLTDVYLDVA